MYDICTLASNFFSFTTKNYDLEKGFTGIWQPRLNKFEQQLKPSYFQFTEIGGFIAFIQKKIEDPCRIKEIFEVEVLNMCKENYMYLACLWLWHRPNAKMDDILIFFCLHSNQPY